MITSDVQTLEPGKRVRLFEVDGDTFGAGVLRFHNDTIPYTPEELAAANGDESKLPRKTIWWQDKEYSPWPVQIEGLETSGDGKSAEPKLTVANLDGSISALCLRFKDMVQAKVTIHDTFSHYLDSRNFPEGNPAADPAQEFIQAWYIDKKSMETNEIIEFTLASPFNLTGLRIPTRQIMSLCAWSMRGDYRTGRGCDYTGDDCFDERGNRVNDRSLDRCGGTLVDCKLRFGKTSALPFGGYPGAALVRR